MVRFNRRPFPAAVRMVSILTAVLVLAGCTIQKESVKEDTDSEEAVLYIEDEPVSEAEYKLLAEEYRNQVSMQYTTEQVNRDDFWQTKIDGTAPWELLDELVRTQLRYNYTLKKIAVELSVTEDYTYEELLETGKEENDSRFAALDSEDGTVYGLKDFDEQTYYKYWYSNLETQVIKALEKNETDVTDADCRNYYDANPEQFSYENGVTVLYAEIPYTQDSKQESDAQAQSIKTAMESTDSVSVLSDAFPDISLQKLDLNSLNTQEGMSGVYSYRWQTASCMDKGEICGPYEDNGMLCIMKCTDRTDKGKIGYEDVKSRIEQYLKNAEAKKTIEEKTEKTAVNSGNISPEKIIIEL